jgi:hypothetical protein
MAKILTFRSTEPRREETSSSARDGNGASAEVIVFPGVRYEHWDEPGDTGSLSASASASKERARAQRRDVLELAE